MLDQVTQLREDRDNRFAFQAPYIPKGYVESRLEIGLELRARRRSEELIGFFRRAGA